MKIKGKISLSTRAIIHGCNHAVTMCNAQPNDTLHHSVRESRTDTRRSQPHVYVYVCAYRTRHAWGNHVPHDIVVPGAQHANGNSRLLAFPSIPSRLVVQRFGVQRLGHNTCTHRMVVNTPSNRTSTSRDTATDTRLTTTNRRRTAWQTQCADSHTPYLPDLTLACPPLLLRGITPKQRRRGCLCLGRLKALWASNKEHL